MPRNNEILRAHIDSMPTDPSYAAFCYANYFAGNTRFPAVYLENTDYLERPSNAYRYAADMCNAGYIVWAIPGTFIGSLSAERERHSNVIRAFSQINTNRLDDIWCGNSESYGLPYKYAGLYLPMVGDRVINTTPHNCPHCALKVTQAHIDSHPNGSRARSVLMFTPGMSINEDYLPAYSPEIAGAQPPETSATIKDSTEPPGYACGNCGRLGHNSRGCEYSAKHHAKIGIEIEGRFLDLNSVLDRARDDGLGDSSDGSLHSSPDSSAKPWELKTSPGSLREAIEQLQRYYPDETDRYCGMHVHVSFLSNQSLTLLQSKAFFEYFHKRWQEWGTRMNLHPDSQFYRRLNGENDYCYPNTEVLRDPTSCDRYTQLNFSAWHSHKTLECRMLPMFQRSSLGVSAVRELIDIYETFLASPEEYGFVFDDFVPVEMDRGILSAAQKFENKFELEIPDFQKSESRFEMELEELLPPANGMVRMAFPVNQPITIEAIAARVRNRAA